ncbi:MAG TPA: cyclase family protein [Polyangiaceae bacterium]|nr:cyclase family protein [Polyangiaceae bacterium]
MARRGFVDLSVSLENGVPSDPPGYEPKIEYIGHKTGAQQIASIFPGLEPKDLPDGEGWAYEKLQVITHNGTHMDAPLHYHSTMNHGERAIGIDEVPLDWCFRPGVKLDFRDKADGHVVSGKEVEAELERIGYMIRPFDIVLVNTAAGAVHGKEGYLDKGCGLGREATLWLLERGVRVVGTDAWSWDAPFSYTRTRFAETHDPSIIWEGHKAGREIGYAQMEKLANLHLLPPFGFTVCCFPFKIKGASAGFTRAVAIFEEESAMIALADFIA